jgi:hypothetical protein
MIFKEKIHKKMYYFILIHMLGHYRFKMNLSIFYHSTQLSNP